MKMITANRIIETRSQYNAERQHQLRWLNCRDVHIFLLNHFLAIIVHLSNLILCKTYKNTFYLWAFWLCNWKAINRKCLISCVHNTIITMVIKYDVRSWCRHFSFVIIILIPRRSFVVVFISALIGYLFKLVIFSRATIKMW